MKPLHGIHPAKMVPIRGSGELFMKWGRCLLKDKGLAKTLWTYAVQTAAHIRNKCFNNHFK